MLTAFFGAWFRISTFLYTWGYDYEKGSTAGTNLVVCLSVPLFYYLYRTGLAKVNIVPFVFYNPLILEIGD